ncbi:MAG: hypothetical protein GQ527_05540, partial [Bacteroidales bacterium]|nr:hypothetical protein [Bacteroidales bacterium]
MKKLAYLLFLVCVPFLLSAQWVTDNEFGFKINVPSNWTKESKMDGTDKIHDFLDPTRNIFLEVRAFKADASINADKIAQVFESQYLSTATRVAFENYTLNNTAGKFAGYTMNVDGLDVGIGAFYAVKNGIGYVLWSMIETKHYQQYSGQGDAILNTFTSFATASNANTQQVIFKITSMKLGKKLTADYDMLPQDESTVFPSDQGKIFVIWDWEGKAPGKKMSIVWYKDGNEIKIARKDYTLPNDKQGYGYANIIMPAGGFIAGNYSVQIDFMGNKKKSISFQIEKAKAASNQNAGFVIKPPSGNGKGLNPGNKPNTNQKTNPPTNTTTSDFMIDIERVKIGSELKPGSKTALINPRNKFYKNTPEIIIAFNWLGNGNGKELKVNWDFFQKGSNNKTHIVSDTYHFPNQDGGESNFILSKPNNGWPIGQYWIEFYLGDQFVYEWRFEVIEGSSSNNSSNSSNNSNGSSGATNWGKASGGASKASSGSSASSTSSSGKVKTI